MEGWGRETKSERKTDAEGKRERERKWFCTKCTGCIHTDFLVNKD